MAYPLNQTCYDLMLTQMTKLGLGTGRDSLEALARMLRIVTDSMESLDIHETYRINGFLVRRRVTGSVFETDTLYFDDTAVVQISESCEGTFISFVNVGAVISDTVISSMLSLAG
ncbi:MAG: hypothetical protein IKP95_03520 [Ruminococcus sp.]|nr:hypothetical protein [Ruminococcus sp.]